METKTKVITALIVIMVAAGGFLVLPTVLADEPPAPLGDGGEGSSIFRRRVMIWRWIINNGEPETLNGEALAVKRFILVLKINDEPVNVVIPRFWTVNGEILNTTELLDNDPFGMGDNMTIETLMVEWVKDTHTVKSYFAYSIQVGDVKASALLPFNIETN